MSLWLVETSQPKKPGGAVKSRSSCSCSAFLRAGEASGLVSSGFTMISLQRLEVRNKVLQTSSINCVLGHQHSRFHRLRIQDPSREMLSLIWESAGSQSRSAGDMS